MPRSEGAAEADDLVAVFLDLEERWTQALVDGDLERARACMTDDFSITTAGWLDAPADGTAWFEHALGRFQLESFVFDEVVVRLYGEVAVVQSRCRQRGTERDSGKTWAMSFRYTDVWLADRPGWRVAIRHATGRPWTEPPPSSPSSA
jgi:ketosteroid isomerase-like protein